MQEPTQDNKAIDPLYYIAFANPMGVQAILYGYGFPQATSFENLYQLGSKLRDMYPDEFSKKIMEIHPDKDSILKLTEKHVSVCNLCTSSFTSEEISRYQNDMSKLTIDRLRELQASLQGEIDKISSRSTTSEAEKKQGALAISQRQQKLDVIIKLIAEKEKENSPKGFSFKNLSTTQKAVGFLAIGVLVGWAVSSLSK